MFGGEAQYGRGAAAVGWLFVDCLLLLLLHSSMFLLPLYALTAAAAEFSNPEYVLEFARERGIRADLVAFLEATEGDVASVRLASRPSMHATTAHEMSLPRHEPSPSLCTAADHVE